MDLKVGNLPVPAIHVGSTPVKSVYVGSKLVWSATVQITLGNGYEARDQFRAALTERGLDYQTITEVPFQIELVGSGSIQEMFRHCSALTTAPAMDTSNVTNMMRLFHSCYALTSVPDMKTSNVTDMSFTFYYCQSLTDGNVRLMGKNSNVYTSNMIVGSSLTREPFDTVQITLGPRYEAQNQLRAAMTARGLNYVTVTEIPFEIEFVGTGQTYYMFFGFGALTSVPAMDTSNVTNMSGMFAGCSSLTSVPDMDTSQVTSAFDMFYGCAALNDGSVRLIGKHPNVNASGMITGSGLTREPWYNADGNPIDVYEVSLTDVRGSSTLHSLLNVTVPAGETWQVRIQGTMTKAYSTVSSQPQVRIGGNTFGPYAQGAVVDVSGTVTSANSTIAIFTRSNTSTRTVSFIGTVTIETVAQITLGADYQARDQLRAALSARGLDYQTVKGIPFGIKLVGSGSAREMFRDCAALTSVPTMDTSGVTSMRSMFYDCSSLVRVPDMDTSQVTHMGWVFYNCASLTSVPTMDTSSATNMYSMFSGCTLLKSVPAMDTSKVTDMSYMFSGCSALTSAPTMNTSQVTSTTWMFNDCASLKSVPTMNTSNVTTMRTMFQRCAALTYVPDLQASNVDDVSYMFYGCSALTDGNVRLIGKHPSVSTTNAIVLSGLTRIPFYNTSGNPI